MYLMTFGASCKMGLSVVISVYILINSDPNSRATTEALFWESGGDGQSMSNKNGG